MKADLRAATKQMRNAATMMSMVAIEAVPEAPGDEKKRAQKLAVQAQVADLKRKAVRRWPFVLGAVVGVWLLGVALYVLWPAPPPEPPAPVVRKPVRPPPEPLVAAVKEPPKVGPEVVAQPVKPDVAPVEPPPGDPPRPIEVTPPPEQVTEAGEEAGDGGEPELREDPKTPIDDVRLGELKRAKKIDERLGEIEVGLKGNEELRTMLEELVRRTRVRCDSARTLSDFFDCEDEVTKQYNRYLNNI